MDVTNLTLIQTLKALEEKQFSKEELNKAYLERIKRLNQDLNAYLYINEESSEIPAAIKDLISVAGMPQTNGSKILEGYLSVFDATVIKKLKEQGVSFNGKVNLDEFAMGSSGENSAFGPTKNPWNITKVPGGSSSGSAVAVAADLATFALGTDTGGSIRQPASFCGVVGLKPSYGRVSRYGAQAMASSLDQIGPITKSVADARLVLEWISGPDGLDSNCHPRLDRGSRESTSTLDSPFQGNDSLRGLKVGIPREYFGKGLDPEVEKVIREALKKLEELGAELVEIDLPHTEYAIAAYYIIMASEVSANLARYTGIRYGKSRDLFGPEPKRRIMLGTFSLSTGYYDAYFTKAAKVRTLIKKDFEKAFEKVDVIVGPVSPTVAWNIGEKVSDPLAMYLMDVYTVPPSLAGIPGLSIPCGFANNMPVGLQILGKHMDEETILNVGQAYEDTTDWKKEKPKL
jgi:aspartyl-tRNA(Asn)/glutamyl-tRNA(Gln) amidotransferase subunit A